MHNVENREEERGDFRDNSGVLALHEYRSLGRCNRLVEAFIEEKRVSQSSVYRAF